ncbi:MAG: glycosyltransferase family 4 protein [Methanoregula sp.]|nr:glycosyltransferase family 4 protein [Methanoregula sp.]
MKILRVVSDLYPAVVGGIGIHAHQMSTSQARRGHEVTVLTLNQNKLTDNELINGYRVVRFPSYFTICGNSFAPGLILEILKRKRAVEIIHAHSHLFFSTNVCALARLFHSAPLIITNHGLISASAPAWLNTLYKHTFSRVTFHIADHIICYTPIEKENIVKLGIDSKKISVIHNGVDTTLFTPRVSEKTTGKKQILWVGRFVTGKGVEYLIEAFSQVSIKSPGTHLVLVGVGPEKPAIEERIKKLNLQSSVTFIDYLDNEKLPGIYKNSDVFVLPSLMEGVPRTILEAMACGIPVVTTNLPHLVSIIDGAGLVVPSKEPTLLSDAILTILEDTFLAEKMGQRGRKRIEQEYSWEDTVGKVLALYESVIDNRA